MSTGFFLTARLGSSRLKRKHLLEVNGRSIVWYLLNRIKENFIHEFERNQIKIVITTSDEPENREFEQFCDQGFFVYYGSKTNIPLRHLQAANHFDCDHIVSIDGDDILCSPFGMRQVFESLRQGSNFVKVSGLPFGMNSWGYSKQFLERSLKGHQNDILETGWGRVFDNQQIKEIAMNFSIQNDLLRFTLDYPEDYRFFTKVIETIGDPIFDMSDENIVKVVMDHKYHLITEAVAKEYWDNFYQVMQQEQERSNS